MYRNIMCNLRSRHLYFKKCLPCVPSPISFVKIKYYPSVILSNNVSWYCKRVADNSWLSLDVLISTSIRSFSIIFSVFGHLFSSKLKLTGINLKHVHKNDQVHSQNINSFLHLSLILFYMSISPLINTNKVFVSFISRSIKTVIFNCFVYSLLLFLHFLHTVSSWIQFCAEKRSAVHRLSTFALLASLRHRIIQCCQFKSCSCTTTAANFMLVNKFVLVRITSRF